MQDDWAAPTHKKISERVTAILRPVLIVRSDDDSGARPDGITDCLETMTVEQPDQAVIYLTDDLRAFKYHPGNHLHERGAEANLAERILGRKDAAATDDDVTAAGA